jgi:DNA-binding response OmpR family regulator
MLFRSPLNSFGIASSLHQIESVTRQAIAPAGWRTRFLARQTLEVLLVLLQKPGKTLTKEELMQAVWPDTFVEEGNR